MPNPNVDLTENSGHGVGSTDGTIEKMSDTGGMNAEVIVIPNEGSEKAAPKNTTLPSWSA